MERLTLKDLFNRFAVAPSSGDPAFAQYNGRTYRGQIHLVNDKPFQIYWKDKIEGQPHDDNVLYVGYDNPKCVWDYEEMAWECSADLD